MAVVSTKKWVNGVSPEDLISDVAVRTLRGRLSAVQAYLPLAAEKSDEDIEHVHQLRVWTRRAAAALQLYEELMPRRRLAWLKKQLKRIRRAANEARDCDVLAERLKKQRSNWKAWLWLEAVHVERAAAQEAIVAVSDRLERDNRFSRRIDKLLERARSRARERAAFAAPRFGDWAHERLKPFVDQFFASAPLESIDESSLHQFRIRGKELRYAMELLAAVFPEEFRSDLYPAIEKIQDRLGQINDMAAAKARLCRKIETTEDPREANQFEQLLEVEQAQLNRSIAQFHEWCTPRLLEKLRAGFERMFYDTAPEPLQPPPNGPQHPDRVVSLLHHD
jgi:CHAD domain-containing protein